MKKNRKTLSVFLVSLLCISMAAGSAFAESVPAYMTISGTPSIDVDISYNDPDSGTEVQADGIMMEGSATSPNLEITSLCVTNKNAMGVIQVEQVEIETVSEQGWTLVADTTDFAKLAADAKKFSLVTDSHDFSTGAYTTVKDVNPDSSITYEFTGKTGPVSAALEEIHVADAVLTLALK